MNLRTEVMQFIGTKMDAFMNEFLKPIETNWQPADFLPDSTQPSFFDKLRDLREQVAALSYDYLAVLVGDTVTEEALPTYESWLMGMQGVNQEDGQGWTRWVRGWTAEENRHGDLLNKFLYLSGRVDMRAMEVSTQYLIADGFDIGTGSDPYRNFVYTSFQELATNLSHRRTATLAKQAGSPILSQICGVIAADEMRHAKAYKAFVSEIFALDPSNMMLAFDDMMRKKIVMPAHFLRETGVKIGETFAHFSDAAQRLGVYTVHDYIRILESLLIDWKIDVIADLSDEAQRARDYLMALPARLTRVAERTKTPSLAYEFSWIG
ncbi:acyl-ACP desaturase [Fibrella sp. WM1]|uniref:acyl-ACP desaturase n=1 Tax=Fibrella musci TaxID=3242485 RepID=UPI003521BFCE